MTLEELNIAVAKAKGLEILFSTEDGLKVQAMNGYSPIMNWAENVGDAWELFDEMEWPKILTTDRYSGVYSKGKWLCGNSGITGTCCLDQELVDGPNGDDCCAMNYWAKDEKNFFAADTPQIAICLAWLKWKEPK